MKRLRLAALLIAASLSYGGLFDDEEDVEQALEGAQVEIEKIRKVGSFLWDLAV